MTFNENKGRKAADYNQLDIFDDQAFGSPDPEILKGYSTGHRDFPRMVESSGLGLKLEHPLSLSGVCDHPMAMGASLWDSFVEVIQPENLLDAATEAAKKAAADAAASLAQQTLDKPAVQAAVAQQVKTTATTATAAKLNTAMDWVTKNQKMILIGSGVVVAAYIALKVMKKK